MSIENPFKKPAGIPLHEKPQDVPIPKPNIIEEAPKAPYAPTPEKPKIEVPLTEEVIPKKEKEIDLPPQVR